MKKRTWIIIALAVLFFAAAIVSLIMEKNEAIKEVEDPEPEPEPDEKPEPAQGKTDLIDLDNGSGTKEN